MNIYIVTMLLCIVFSFFELATSGKHKLSVFNSLWFIIMFLLMFFIAGFREVGYDYNSYEYFYQELSGHDWFVSGMRIGSEPGYSFLNYISGSYKGLIAIMSFLNLIILFSFFKKYSKLPLLSIVIFFGLFFLSGTMGQQRQALAIAISLYAIINIENKRKAVLIVLCASMFHISAMLALIALFVSKDYKSIKTYLTAFLVAVLISLTAHIVYLNVIDVFPPFIAGKLATYARMEATPLGLNSAVLLRMLIFLICYFNRNSFKGIGYMPFLINCYFVSLIIYTSLGFAPQLAGRGSSYFSILEIIICANLVYSLKDIRKIIFFAIFIGMAMFRLTRFLNASEATSLNNIDYLPYLNWLM